MQQVRINGGLKKVAKTSEAPIKPWSFWITEKQ